MKQISYTVRCSNRYCKFAHIEYDDDLDAIRNRADFKEMISKYKEKLSARIEKMKQGQPADDEEQITEVAITRRSGGGEPSTWIAA